MHVSSHIRPFTPEFTAPPRETQPRPETAESTGVARIAGYPDESRRQPARRRFAPDLGRPDPADDVPFDEEPHLTEAAQTLTVTLTTLELAMALGKATIPRIEAAPPRAAHLPDEVPSLDDLLAQALAGPAAAQD